MSIYRVKEKVGTQQFIVQQKFRIKTKIENPKWYDKLYFFWTAIKNEDEYEWWSLNKGNEFSQRYYTKYFDTLEEAIKVIEDFKTKGEVKMHII